MRKWVGEQVDWHINTMELFVVVDFVEYVRELSMLHNAILRVRSDNTSVVGWMRKLGANGVGAQVLLREVALVLVQHNAMVVVTWVVREFSQRHHLQFPHHVQLPHHQQLAHHLQLHQQLR